ncbi:MAG: lysylphosphatidylglycerol synthase transmembrane domain-containing protein [Bacteroidetes bacterium]|nr:lysylphosphatidylglycerol synthase transmembrane domain-containing protein [Bacteroidota bacterium]MDA0903386.1 lysylphosphatidylglycerol synthase transmembrane domain-containing protein [Bacteroidota bacterium]MDA1241582.1 lysylphosphatidylglycerol synthase transmembrane domain-containing protein [Bacteroidota bacterium]
MAFASPPSSSPGSSPGPDHGSGARERSQTAATNLFTARRLWWVVAASVIAAVGVALVGGIQGSTWQALVNVDVAWEWVGVACLAVVVRDVGYMVRLGVLTQGHLGKKRTASSILLWELASALTPSVVGGSAVAAFILHRNGLTWGRSLATVMATAMLDEMFFILAVLGVALVAGTGAFLPQAAPWIEGSLGAVFAGGCGFMLGLAVFLACALLLNPRGVNQTLLGLSSRKVLMRWKDRIASLANDLLEASRSLRSMPTLSWGLASLATVASWTARFATLHVLLLAVVEPLVDAMGGQAAEGLSHAAVWARQLAMWTVLMISPTPGSAGLAEFALPAFMQDLMPCVLAPAAWTAIVLLWRWLTYHIYLLVGAVLMPFWVAQTSAPNHRSSRNFEAHE